MTGGYRIVDEPRSSVLGSMAVSSFWPLLALMLSGAWVALPWLVLNGYAVGSATRGREAVLALLGAVGAVLLGMLLSGAVDSGTLPVAGARYAALAVTVWKVAFGYAIFVMQQRSVDLFVYYGGRLNSGLLPLLAAAAIRAAVIRYAPALMAVGLA